MLLDSGSTHNFIQEGIVRFITLPILTLNQFYVMIGNGDQLVCNTQSLKVPILLCNTIFTIDFFILPISDGDLVLGVQW